MLLAFVAQAHADAVAEQDSMHKMVNELVNNEASMDKFVNKLVDKLNGKMQEGVFPDASKMIDTAGECCLEQELDARPAAFNVPMVAGIALFSFLAVGFAVAKRMTMPKLLDAEAEGYTAVV